jgi:hypothetical protein
VLAHKLPSLVFTRRSLRLGLPTIGIWSQMKAKICPYDAKPSKDCQREVSLDNCQRLLLLFSGKAKMPQIFLPPETPQRASDRVGNITQGPRLCSYNCRGNGCTCFFCLSTCGTKWCLRRQERAWRQMYLKMRQLFMRELDTSAALHRANIPVVRVQTNSACIVKKKRIVHTGDRTCTFPLLQTLLTN